MKSRTNWRRLRADFICQQIIFCGYMCISLGPVFNLLAAAGLRVNRELTDACNPSLLQEIHETKRAARQITRFPCVQNFDRFTPIRCVCSTVCPSTVNLRTHGDLHSRSKERQNNFIKAKSGEKYVRTEKAHVGAA